MAGRKVRCRNCGQIFTIPAPGQAPAVPNTVSAPTGAATGESSPFDALLNLPPAEAPAGQVADNAPRATPAVRTSQSNMSGGIGSAKSMMERIGNPDAFDLTDTKPESALRPSQPFTFPFAAELDRFMPAGLIWPLLIWVAYMGLFGWKPDLEEGQLQPGWAGVLPMALLLLLFWAVWRSAFAIAMRMVARSFKFELPPNHKLRAAALAALPFGLGTVFWFAGEGIGTLVTGVVLGLAISVPAAWFLYRLKENELPYAAAGSAAAAAIASVLSIGLYVGINLGLNQTLIASGSSKTFAVSPFGPDLPWPGPKAPPVKTAPPPSKTRIASEQDTNPDRQPLLQDSKLFSFERDAQQLIFAPGRTDVVAVVSRAENSRDMEIRRYTLDANGQALPLDQQSSPFASGAPVCLSRDADFMTRLVKFMGKPTLQAWSFKDYRITDSYSPTDWQTGEFRMVGFGPSHSLICTIQSKVAGGASLRILSVDVETSTSNDWQTKSKDPHGPMVALSGDGEKLAAIAIGKDKANKDEPQIRVYGRDGKTLANVILPIPDVDFALNPSGLAFSPDGSMISVAYEQGGQTSILTNPATGMGTATLAVLLGTATPAAPAAAPAAPPTGPRSGPPFIPPSPPSGPSFGPPPPGGPKPREPEKRTEPARENQLVWLAGGDKWLYGRMIIDGGTQRSLGTIEGNAKSPVAVVRGQQIMTMAPAQRGMGLLRATIVGTTTPSTPAGTAPAATEP